VAYTWVPERMRRRLRRRRFVRYYRDLPYNFYMQSQFALRRTLRPVRPDLSSRERQAFEDVQRHGFTRIENYWPRQRAVTLGEALERTVSIEEDRTLDCGATVKVRFNSRPDGGIRRVYDVEKLHTQLVDVRFDPLPFRIAASLSGIPFGSSLLVYQYDSGAGATGGPWHIDTFYSEFKTLLFLKDVDESCGPTAYIPGSHRLWKLRLKNEFFDYLIGRDVRFFEETVLGKLAKQQTLLCGKAGTLIVFDGRGLHRSTAQQGRSRSLLMNYLQVDRPNSAPAPGERPPEPLRRRQEVDRSGRDDPVDSVTCSAS